MLLNLKKLQKFRGKIVTFGYNSNLVSESLEKTGTEVKIRHKMPKILFSVTFSRFCLGDK